MLMWLGPTILFYMYHLLLEAGEEVERVDICLMVAQMVLSYE
jgi:hypothetical protein